MKKTFAVLASMLGLTGAWAQSSVTVYGLLDLSVGRSETGSGTTLPGGAGTATPSSQRLYRMDSGLGYGSRLGFRGTEDLGDGLNARFVMEMGIGADSGGLNQGGLAWGRQSFVGIGGRGWSLTAGRQYTPMNNAVAGSEPLNGGSWGDLNGEAVGTYETIGSTAGNGTFQINSRADNSLLLQVTSGPLTGYAMAAAGNENSRGTGRYLSLGGNYTSGPLKLNAVYARFRQNAEQITATASPEWLSQWMVGGSYDFGAAVAYAGYFVFNAAKNKANLSALATLGSPTAAAQAYAWDKNQLAWVGVRVPVSVGSFAAQVARETYPYSGAADGKSTILALLYEYPMSKRTTTYASYGKVTNNDRARTPLYGAIPLVGPNGFGSDPSAISVGLRHSF